MGWHSRIVGRFLAPCWLALELLTWPVSAVGQPPATEGEVITLAVIPSQLALAPGGQVEVTVALANSGTTPATVNALKITPPPGVTAEPHEEPAPFSLGPGERTTRTLEVSIRYDASPGTLTVAADVSAPVVEGSGLTTDRFVVATAAVQPATPPGELVVSIASAPGTLSDGQTDAHMQVLLRNTTSLPMGRVELWSINSLDVRVVGQAAPPCHDAQPAVVTCLESLGPGEAALVQLDLNVDDTVRTGPQTVGVAATATLLDRPVSTSATTEIELTVFGTTALGALGSSSLVLFPAIVSFVVFATLSRLIYPRATWLPAKVDATDLSLLVVLIPLGTLALVIVWLFFGVDTTREVSTPLVAAIYAMAIGIGAGLWLLYAIGYHRTIGRKLFKSGDTPHDVLKRLATNDTTLDRPLVKGSTTAEMILGRGSGGTVALAAPVRYDLEDLTPEERREFSNAVTAGRPADVLAHLSQKGGSAPERPPGLSWASTGVRLVTEEPATEGHGSLLQER